MATFPSKTRLTANVIFALLLLSVAAAVGCSGAGPLGTAKDDGATDAAGGQVTDPKNGDGVNDQVLAADHPADSTGALAPVSLDFSVLKPAAAGLSLADAAGLDVGGGILLTDARLSIGSIKVKANKEYSDEEVEVRKALEAAREERKAAMKADKDAIEAKKEQIEKDFEAQKEGATDDEKDALEDAMEAKKKAVEEELAALEGSAEDELAKLEAEKDNNTKWQGPFVFDLISGGVAPEIPAVELVDGSYRRIEFKIKPNRVLDGADPLLNRSVYVAGTVDVGGVATPFTVGLRVDEEFKLMGTGAFKVDPAAPNSLTVAFAPATWFTGVDLASATADAAGVIVVDEVNNKSVYEAIRKNLKRSTKFGKDEDGDGELGDDESEGDGEEHAAEEGDEDGDEDGDDDGDEDGDSAGDDGDGDDDADKAEDDEGVDDADDADDEEAEGGADSGADAETTESDDSESGA